MTAKKVRSLMIHLLMVVMILAACAPAPTEAPPVATDPTALRQALAELLENAREAVECAYARGESDEFVKPTVIETADGLKQAS